MQSKKEWKDCLKRLKETRDGIEKNMENSKYNIKINEDQLEELEYTIESYVKKIETFK